MFLSTADGQSRGNLPDFTENHKKWNLYVPDLRVSISELNDVSLNTDDPGK